MGKWKELSEPLDDRDAPADAASELRRLHEVNAELVEAAKLSLIAFKGHWNMDKTHRDRTAMDATIAALAKAEGK